MINEEENLQVPTEQTEGGLVEDSNSEVEVEIKEPSDMEEVIEEAVEAQKEFYSNLAEDMDDRTLSRISSELIQDYKK